MLSSTGGARPVRACTAMEPSVTRFPFFLYRPEYSEEKAKVKCPFFLGYFICVEIHGVKRIIARLLLFIASCSFGGFFSSVRSQEKPKDEPQLVKPENIQGCYELTLSEWRPKLNIGEDAEFISPPHRVQLFAERGTKGWEAEGYIVRPAPGVAASIHRGSYWLPKKDQSIEIVWTTGFSGLAMGLKLENGELHGKAKSFWDFPRKKQTADVIARKVDCQKP